MLSFEYTRKPSITTIRAAVIKAINAGETWIQIIWGENQITLEKSPYGGWIGYGWIGRNGGQDLAHEITRIGRA